MDSNQILLDTRTNWDSVGPDFILRLDAPEETGSVVPFRAPLEVAPPDQSSGTEWALAQAVLHKDNPGIFGSWMRGLERVERAG